MQVGRSVEGILGDYPMFNVYGLRDTKVCLWWGVCVSSAKYCFSGREIGQTNLVGLFFDGIHEVTVCDWEFHS